VKVLDLFSGIGGFSLGLERAGFETVAFCEIDPFCRKVLNKHWPDVPIHEDIKELDGEQYKGTVELVCGGFPCQPFSVAGKQRGADDDRALWPEMLRVIREVQPTWVIGENVIGLEGLALEQCVFDLEGDGFSVQVFDIPACGVGAVHRRHRLWIVAHAKHDAGRKRTERGSIRDRRSELHGAEGDVANTDSSQLRKQSGRSCWSSGEKTTQSEFYGNQWISANTELGWPTESPVCGADDGIPNRLDRLRALGNALVVQIPEILGRAILENRMP
jgi:DNA (cytosine-5)-methyltransferase 1